LQRSLIHHQNGLRLQLKVYKQREIECIKMTDGILRKAKEAENIMPAAVYTYSH
jgi:hypothetical protein